MPVTTDFTQEIRFAVVLYGGSSLAVYMNGVAQELLHLVRATAPAISDQSTLHVPDAELNGSERVYRQLGQMLSRGNPARIVDPGSASVRTRFVIDVLSGTSAGGINGVFLAKALVNDQSMTSLRDLWLKTADFDKLLNDNQSGSSPKAQDPPRSLVNSPFMYAELLRALNKMDTTGNARRSPYTDQLDLFTTLTDIQGQNVSLKLADVVATELRHRQSLHFSYSTQEATGEEANDFLPEYNEFIAFAARCTSAHPAAFEPMALEDIAAADANPRNPKWQKFYEDYLQPSQESVQPFDERSREDLNRKPTSREDLLLDFQKRPFSDGGVLDNSPFSFAIDQLPFRNVSLPVDRKLLYVEPAPDHPELVKQTDDKPDPITNAVLSVSSLPSYQSIRDDIRRVLDRNRLVERVDHILSGLEDDVRARGDLPVVSSDDFRTMDVREMIGLMGSGWGGYQRLRVAETTDSLVEIINRAAGFNDDSSEWLAIRYVVGWWRYLNYSPYKLANDKRQTENSFLYTFDLRHHIRRLKFVLRKIAEISCFDEKSQRILTRYGATAEIAELRSATSERGSSLRREFRHELSLLTAGLNNVLKDLYALQNRLTARVDPKRPEKHPLAVPLAALHISSPQLIGILDQTSEGRRMAAATNLLGENGIGLQPVVDALVQELSIIPASAAQVRSDVLKLPGDVPGTPARVARETLLYYYDHFDQFDMVSYPIVYSTDVGDEIDQIEVLRISPEDVSSLIENKLDRRRKLAGLSLGHFGALLEERFRLNDILWGRLDAAERLITALLESAAPPADESSIAVLHQKQSELIRQAQLSILVEELDKCDDAMKKFVLGDCDKPGTLDDPERQRMLDELNRAPIPPDVRAFFESCLESGDPLRKFVRNYDFEHKPNPQKLIETAGRASRILGKMLDGIADARQLRSPQLRWVTRLFKIFWGLVEISLPDTALNILTRHFLKLIYLFEALMIVGGILLLNPTVQQFGTVALAVTLAIDVVMYILTDLMRGRHVVLKLVGAFITGILILSTVLGIALLATILGADSLTPFIQSLLPGGGR